MQVNRSDSLISIKKHFLMFSALYLKAKVLCFSEHLQSFKFYLMFLEIHSIDSPLGMDLFTTELSYAAVSSI